MRKKSLFFTSLLSSMLLVSACAHRASQQNLPEPLKKALDSVPERFLDPNASARLLSYSWSYGNPITCIRLASDCCWKENELCLIAVKAIESVCLSLEEHPPQPQPLFFSPSNIYFYALCLQTPNSILFANSGHFALIQKGKVVWEKTFEEVLRDFKISCTKLSLNTGAANFSDDPTIQKAFLSTHERIVTTLKKQGYNSDLSFFFDRLNKLADPDDQNYKWVFYLEKNLPDIQENEEPVAFEKSAYKQEYKRLITLITTMINESPELKPYLQTPVLPRDILLGYTWKQSIVKQQQLKGHYKHLVFKVGSVMALERNKELLGEKQQDKEVQDEPLEEFFQSIGI